MSPSHVDLHLGWCPKWMKQSWILLLWRAWQNATLVPSLLLDEFRLTCVRKERKISNMQWSSTLTNSIIAWLGGQLGQLAEPRWTTLPLFWFYEEMSLSIDGCAIWREPRQTKCPMWGWCYLIIISCVWFHLLSNSQCHRLKPSNTFTTIYICLCILLYVCICILGIVCVSMRTWICVSMLWYALIFHDVGVEDITFWAALLLVST